VGVGEKTEVVCPLLIPKNKQKKDEEKRRGGKGGEGKSGRSGSSCHHKHLQTSFLNTFKFYFVLRSEKLVNAMKMKCDENETMSRKFSKHKRKNA
jgi:hypothetical protein